MVLPAELVQMRLFDLGGVVDLARLGTVLGSVPQPAPVISHSPSPPSTTFPQPHEVVYTPREAVPGTRVEVRIHAVGVLAIRVRCPTSVGGLAGLAAAAEAVRVDGLDVEAACRAIADRVLPDVKAALDAEYDARRFTERYVAYCVHAPPSQVSQLLQDEALPIAQLVSDSARQDLGPGRLAAAMKHTMQYSPGDAVVLGWDHAVILDEPGEYEDILDVLELANLELLEFRAYDAYLDRRLEGAFAALDRLWAPGGLFRSARGALQDISRLRVEFARLTDNLHDTGKIFGDWYTAQLHRRLHERFHLASWEKAVATKMATLEDMFHLAQEEANHRRSLVLEIMIVLLFILDLVLLVRLEA